MCNPALSKVEDTLIGILMNQALEYVTKSNTLFKYIKENLVNKMPNYLCTLTIYYKNDKVSITEGTISHKLITDIMSRSQSIMLMCNTSNDKAVVTKGSSSTIGSLLSININSSKSSKDSSDSKESLKLLNILESESIATYKRKYNKYRIKYIYLP